MKQVGESRMQGTCLTVPRCRSLPILGHACHNVGSGLADMSVTVAVTVVERNIGSTVDVTCDDGKHGKAGEARVAGGAGTNGALLLFLGCTTLVKYNAS